LDKKGILSKGPLIDSITNFTIDGHKEGNGFMGITTYIIIIVLNKKPVVSIYPNDIDKVANSQWVLNIYWKDPTEKDKTKEMKHIALRF